MARVARNPVEVDAALRERRDRDDADVLEPPPDALRVHGCRRESHPDDRILAPVKAMRVSGEWAPRKGYEPGPEEGRTRVARSGSMVWRAPEFAVAELPDPEIGPDE